MESSVSQSKPFQSRSKGEIPGRAKAKRTAGPVRIEMGVPNSFRRRTFHVLNSPVWILKRLVSVFINACRLLSALPSLSQFGRGRLSLVAISFYALSLLFGPCRLSEGQGLFINNHTTWEPPLEGPRDQTKISIVLARILFRMQDNCRNPVK